MDLLDVLGMSEPMSVNTLASDVTKAGRSQKSPVPYETDVPARTVFGRRHSNSLAAWQISDTTDTMTAVADYNKKDKVNKDDARKDCTWKPVFEHKKDFKGWNRGKYAPTSARMLRTCTRSKDGDCNSYQVYSEDEVEEKFICELFEEIIDKSKHYFNVNLLIMLSGRYSEICLEILRIDR
ncbi:uncharacterized protein EV420DRAFT_1473184 [Desarmillaria tabescens]|uniref:Uncharacterized protein n=1 Tax=Armillaria tabescens TaxID=1929756 RepID=A0AA39T7M2_ARMTA|nr:uncharacterized protein EV420DRAFT_1473184 [Desarmillaria tabescens]KAK0470081.1 hypothetical protein EV420DRAFT_1473184 [Desarmillaria tabescens]